MSFQFVNDIPMDGDQLTVEELQVELLQVIMRLAGQLRNVRNPSALARTLHRRKNQEGKRPRGRPPQHTVGADRLIEELHHSIIEIALRLAGEANAKTKWRGLHRALRYFRSEDRRLRRRQVGRPRENRFPLHMLIEIHRKPGETNVAAIARRMIDSGAVAMEQRKLEDLVADVIGTRPKAEPARRKTAKKRPKEKMSMAQAIARNS
jgi:hypothetical protein